MLVASFLFNTSTELTPDHSDAITLAALCIAPIGGIAAFAALLVFRSRPDRLSAAALSSGATLLLFLNVMSWGSIIATRADFTGGDAAQWRGTVPIGSARLTYSKGTHYYVTLRPYRAEMTVSRSDYRRAFGDTPAPHPAGLCLRADLERDGRALRILHGSMSALPDGSIVRC